MAARTGLPTNYTALLGQGQASAATVGFHDPAGNPFIVMNDATSAVNALEIDTAATGSAVTLKPGGRSVDATAGLTIAALSTGTLTLGATGNTVTMVGTTGLTGALTLTTGTAVTQFAVGTNGATTPTFAALGSSTAVTGISVTGSSAGAGVAIAVTSSGAAENMTIDAKGSGTITLGGTSTGNVICGGTGVFQVKGSSGAVANGGPAIYIGTGATGVLGIYFGSGAPTVTAGQGSLYLRTDGSSTGNRAYINTTSSGTWTALTTAA